VKNVLLVDLVSWEGHHRPYFLLYTRLLLELGYTVDALCLGNYDVEIELQEAIRVGKLRLLQPKLTLIQRVVLKLFQPLGLDIRLIARWLVIKNVFVKQNRNRETFVFLLDLQGYLGEIQEALQQWLLPPNWAGLYVCPPSIEAILQGSSSRSLIKHSSCKGLCLLNEAIVEKLQAQLQETPVFHFPDVSYIHCRDDISESLEKILHWADGRKIVLMASLTQKHGLIHFLRLAELMQDEPILFCAIGLVRLNGYTPDEISYIKNYLEFPPDNLFVLTDFYPDEETLNSIFRAADVTYICYENFGHSSNKLTKSICLETPVLVTKNTLLGARVQHYHLGYAVEPSNAKELAKYLDKLLYEFHFNERDRTAFISYHSEATLKQKLATLIP
jgi:glycosyltransferase involved in cell wall biosynthesis